MILLMIANCCNADRVRYMLLFAFRIRRCPRVLLSLCFSRCFLSPLLPRFVVLSLVGVVVEVVHRLLSPLRDVVGIFSPYVHARRHTCPPSQLPAHPRPLRLQQQQQQHPWLITTISQLHLGLPASPPPSAENSMREHYSFRLRPSCAALT